MVQKQNEPSASVSPQHGERALPVILEGTIIIPYRKGFPIMLFENTDQSSPDCYVRARLHLAQNVWYGDVDETSNSKVSTPRNPHHHKSQGVIVFVPAQELTASSGIRVVRTFNSGKSARGMVTQLPRDWHDLYTHDTRGLFKPL